MGIDFVCNAPLILVEGPTTAEGKGHPAIVLIPSIVDCYQMKASRHGTERERSINYNFELLAQKGNRSHMTNLDRSLVISRLARFLFALLSVSFGHRGLSSIIYRPMGCSIESPSFYRPPLAIPCYLVSLVRFRHYELVSY